MQSKPRTVLPSSVYRDVRRAWLDASDVTTDVEQSFALGRIAAIRAVPD